jgi:hypothetical protein
MITTSSQQLKDVAWLEEQEKLIAVCHSKYSLGTACCMESSAHTEFEDLSQVSWFGLAQQLPSEASFQRWSYAHLCLYTRDIDAVKTCRNVESYTGF